MAEGPQDTPSPAQGEGDQDTSSSSSSGSIQALVVQANEATRSPLGTFQTRSRSVTPVLVPNATTPKHQQPATHPNGVVSMPDIISAMREAAPGGKGSTAPPSPDATTTTVTAELVRVQPVVMGNMLRSPRSEAMLFPPTVLSPHHTMQNLAKIPAPVVVIGTPTTNLATNPPPPAITTPSAPKSNEIPTEKRSAEAQASISVPTVPNHEAVGAKGAVTHGKTESRKVDAEKIAVKEKTKKSSDVVAQPTTVSTTSSSSSTWGSSGNRRKVPLTVSTVSETPVGTAVKITFEQARSGEYSPINRIHRKVQQQSESRSSSTEPNPSAASASIPQTMGTVLKPSQPDGTLPGKPVPSARPTGSIKQDGTTNKPITTSSSSSSSTSSVVSSSSVVGPAVVPTERKKSNPVISAIKTRRPSSASPRRRHPVIMAVQPTVQPTPHWAVKHLDLSKNSPLHPHRTRKGSATQSNKPHHHQHTDVSLQSLDMSGIAVPASSSSTSSDLPAAKPRGPAAPAVPSPSNQLSPISTTDDPTLSTPARNAIATAKSTMLHPGLIDNILNDQAVRESIERLMQLSQQIDLVRKQSELRRQRSAERKQMSKMDDDAGLSPDQKAAKERAIIIAKLIHARNNSNNKSGDAVSYGFASPDFDTNACDEPAPNPITIVPSSLIKDGYAKRYAARASLIKDKKPPVRAASASTSRPAVAEHPPTISAVGHPPTISAADAHLGDATTATAPAFPLCTWRAILREEQHRQQCGVDADGVRSADCWQRLHMDGVVNRKRKEAWAAEQKQKLEEQLFLQTCTFVPQCGRFGLPEKSVMFGYLLVQKTVFWSRRYYELDPEGGALWYSDTPTSLPKKLIFLQDVVVAALKDVKGKRFMIRCKNKEIVLKAATPQDCQGWIAAIKGIQMGRLLEGTAPRRVSSVSFNPILSVQTFELDDTPSRQLSCDDQTILPLGLHECPTLVVQALQKGSRAALADENLDSSFIIHSPNKSPNGIGSPVSPVSPGFAPEISSPVMKVAALASDAKPQTAAEVFAAAAPVSPIINLN